VPVAPRDLEDALDALAQLDFPINPQIYHDAVSIYRYADAREEIVPTTLVEFPAYAGRLPEIRRVLESRGVAGESVHVMDMLEGIHTDTWVEPAPPGAAYQTCTRRKHSSSAVALT
jgi:hypothetical protein